MTGAEATAAVIEVLSYVRGWCERHGTSALLDEICRSIPAV
jgi:hypothetical protein